MGNRLLALLAAEEVFFNCADILIWISVILSLLTLNVAPHGIIYIYMYLLFLSVEY